MKIKYKDYSDVKGKVRREVAAGNLIPIMRGLYETDATISGKYLAGHIYGPSYLSFDYALSVYSLIPETVFNTFTSATFKKSKTKTYQNQFGTFIYKDVPEAVYSFGVLIKEEGGYTYIDICTLFKDSEGYFAEKYAESDGLHFQGSTYTLMLGYIQKTIGD